MVKKSSGVPEKRLLARRIFIYSLAAFVLGVLQCSFFARLQIFGATPDLLLGSICAIVLLDDKRVAMVYAVAAGYFIDAIGAVPPSFSPLFYLVFALIAATIAEKLIPRFLSYVLLTLPVIFLGALFTFVELWISVGALPSLTAWLGIALREMLCTFVLCLPVFFLIKLCTLPIGARSKFSF